MQKIENSSFKAVSHPLSQRNWLEVAEYASVAGSAIGTLTAVLSGQFIYAAAPLTLALSLNLANRQRFEEQVRENANSAIADIHTVVESIHRQVHAIPENSQDIDAILSDLQQKLRVLETNVLGQQDWETVNVRFLLMDEKLTDIKNNTADLPKRSGDTSDFNEVKASVNQLEYLTNQPAKDLTALEAQINRLQEQVSQLQYQNREIIKPYLQRLTRAVKQLQEN
ncbi:MULTISPECIES: hypothetical protein [Kamptonema]|uniref:hypothetical protein n=1 Tax=Kamptonema TaxID=1501433 RepID=UPI0001DAC302|nr:MULTISPECIES: hypothetical protein [Kamptonema]CBN57897.1 conserved hypothetical protein [Kamptonema sp. PCC 6506]